NKVMLIGRLTRDPEAIQVRGANAGAKFGFAVNNRKLNQDTQQWEEIPVFIDCEIWNAMRGESKQGDRFLQTVRKGQQVYIEGHLKMDQWEDKNGGGKRSKLLVVVESFQYLEARQDGGGGNMGEAPMRAPRQAAAPAKAGAPAARSYAPSNNYDDSDMGAPPGKGGGDDDIPF
ncbi:MAG: single-stranded DNA-binding protein, partial [Planctomycetia bacterium]|nr:single-stranded DNA-binding protein [Planctomycetia bacterium]